MGKCPMWVLHLLLILCSLHACNGGTTSNFVRKLGASQDMPLDSDVFRVPPGYNAPQQVHITQGDYTGKAVIISWVTTSEPGSSTVLYGTAKHKREFREDGKVTTYKFYDYRSGFLHHCTIKNLEYDTEYFYEVGIGLTRRQFSFKTPPAVGPDVPYAFGIIGIFGTPFPLVPCALLLFYHMHHNP